MSSPTTTTSPAENATVPRGRRVYTPQEKTDCLALFEQSEMSQADFCREMGLNESTFSVWVRASRGESSLAEPNVATPPFAEVQLRAPTSADTTVASVTVRLPGGAKLEVNAAGEAVWRGLGLLLKTLQS